MGGSTKKGAGAPEHQLCLAFALTLVFTSTTAVEPNPTDILLVNLEAMRVKEPAAVLAAMQSLGLEDDEDFAILNDAEREEMMSGLGAQGISLGDRSKARHHFSALVGGDLPDFADAGDEHPHDRTTVYSAPRRMQDSGGGGTNFDTIAIALSVLVGAAGYMVQAWSTRRAERSAADRALELQHSELTRQREHEQMVSQIERTERWLDQCCRPVVFGLHSLVATRMSYVADTVFEMETSHPETVAEMLVFSAVAFPIGADGKVTSSASGRVMWDPDPPAQLTRNFGFQHLAMPSAAACSILNIDMVHTLQQPYCDELPHAILDVVAADPTGSIADSYRRYIRTVWVPAVQHLADVLEAHSAVIEWPTSEWLAKQFPQVPWHAAANFDFGLYWMACAMSWGRVLAEWDDAENFSMLRPASPMSFGGLIKAIGWSLKRGEAAQQELIGMTAEAEIDVSYLASITTTARSGAVADKQAPAPHGTFETEDT
jgi:hypothetical protein